MDSFLSSVLFCPVLTLVTRCVMSEALRKKVFFITLLWFDSNVHTSEQRVSVLATSSNVDTESGTRVSSTGRRMGGGLASCVTSQIHTSHNYT